MTSEGPSASSGRDHHFHPTPIQDPSAGQAGLIAGELMAEEASLLEAQSAGGPSKRYGATERNPDNDGDDSNGFALPKTKLYILISCVYMAVFMAALDGTVVASLLTVIASDLNQVGNISWIATSYLVSSAAFQPLFGKLSDIFGRRAILLICGALFTVGCLICATESFSLLILGRFIAGCGGSGFTSLGTIVMSDLIPLRERGVFQGIGNICFGLGYASGGFIGGVVADWLGWRWVFILQVPLILLVSGTIHIFLHLPEGSPGLGVQGEDVYQKLKRVDFLGASLLVAGLISFMIAASIGGRIIPFKSLEFVGLLVLSVGFIVVYTYVELNVSEEPILPLEVLGIRTVLASSFANWFFTMGTMAYSFYVPVFFSAVLGLSPTQTGLRLVPNFFGVSGGSLAAGIYMKKTGRYWPISAVLGGLAVLGSFRLLQLSPTSSNFAQYTVSLLPGIGYSCMLTTSLLALIASVPMKYQASTTSIQYTFRSTGSTIGVTVASAIFQQILKSRLISDINSLVSDKKLAAKIISRALASSSYASEAPEYVQGAIRGAYQAGCRGAFVLSVVTIAAGYICILFVKEYKLHTSMSRD